MNRVRILSGLCSEVLEKCCCESLGCVSFALESSWNKVLQRAILCSVVFCSVNWLLISLWFLGISVYLRNFHDKWSDGRGGGYIRALHFVFTENAW